MPLTTIPEVEEYLQTANIPSTNVGPLSGGSANFVWLIQNGTQPLKVLKHAEPYVASNISIPFALDRMDYEARVLDYLPSVISSGPAVRLPTVHRYDQEAHVLLFSYGGPRTLKDAYTDTVLDIPDIGHQIGSWLADLHALTTQMDIGNNVTAKQIYRYPYASLASAFEKFGLDPTLGHEVNEKYGTMIQNDDVCVCHGDFWPGNVLLSSETGILSSFLPLLTIVDWEMVRRGNGATDVAQFAAESFLLDRFCGGKGLLPAFLEAYTGAKQQEREFSRRIAVHFGVHVAFWPTRVEWGTEDETRELVGFGREMIERVEGRDWGWLKDSVLGILFP